MRRYIHFAVALLAFATLVSLMIGLVKAGNKSGLVVTAGLVATSPVVVRAAGRGNPHINLADGVELAAEYTGAPEALRLIAEGRAESRALASADFDEDGVPDLVCGYAHTGGGLITLHRGNVDSIFENNPEAQRRKAEGTFTDAAFLSFARVFEAPIAADFVGAGDFDGDGHWDVVIGASGGKELCLMPGDGKGSLLASRRIALPGTLTSLVTGEINRSDGLTDVVAGVVAAGGPKVLVFEGPEGALKANPEIFSLLGEPRALALGQFDNEYTMDLAVGAGSELVIIHGRDRKLSLDEIRQAEVLPARLDRRAFGFEIRSIAAGDFTGSNETSLGLLASDGTVYLVGTKPPETSKKKREDGDVEIIGQFQGATQLVCARVSAGPANDLILLNQDRRELQILKTGISGPTASSVSAAFQGSTSLDLDGGPAAVLPMRLNADALSDIVLFQSGHSLPAVLKTAPGMVFTVNSADDHDDGLCDSSDCTLREAILAANGNAGADMIGFDIPGVGVHTMTAASALPSVDGPTTIDGTTQPGFGLTPIIELNGNWRLDARLALTGGLSTVRGLVINRISDNGISVRSTGNKIEGCFLGTDVTGTAVPGNLRDGVLIANCSDNTVGGTVDMARNVISGNFGNGVDIVAGSNGPDASRNSVLGNRIGTNISGGSALPNGRSGVIVSSGVPGPQGSNNAVGGTTAGSGNVISGNRWNGVYVLGSLSNGTLIQGNLIGTSASGTSAMGNSNGVEVDHSSNNTIGGTAPTSRNVISGNRFTSFGGGTGVQIIDFGNGSATTGNVVQGNFIGIDAAGATPIPNELHGVGISNASGNTIGGIAIGAGNTIAFNGFVGVTIANSPSITTIGNAIVRNSIFSNTGLGIDLGFNGVTLNDPCDSDVDSNNSQNFPLLTAAASADVSTSIQGALDSTPNTTFTIEFFANARCHASGFGEGQTFIGSTTVTTGTDCGATFNVSLPVGVPAGQFITATATDPAGNTSEFSQCAQVAQGPSSFDLCLQDDSGRGVLKFNSSTGDYLFTNCNGVTLAGTGTLVRRGSTITLQHYAADRRVLATLNTGAKKGTATIQLFSPRSMFTLTDRNLSNNTCNCGATSGFG